LGRAGRGGLNYGAEVVTTLTVERCAIRQLKQNDKTDIENETNLMFALPNTSVGHLAHCSAIF
jgi:hypothetical protein